MQARALRDPWITLRPETSFRQFSHAINLLPDLSLELIIREDLSNEAQVWRFRRRQLGIEQQNLVGLKTWDSQSFDTWIKDRKVWIKDRKVNGINQNQRQANILNVRKQTFNGPRIFGNKSEEHPSGDCPNAEKGVWNVALFVA